tara:strand:- start:20 stop:547 length:528 start_codon:yes stop_codon:yes gene_type:complete
MMLWKVGGWFLLLIHFFFPEPYREQILAFQTILITFSPKILSFHIATGIIVCLYLLNLNESSIDIVAELAHHAAVFIAVISEFYFRAHRYTCWVLLFWSLRWMNVSNIYVESPWHAFVRCCIFGFVVHRDFSLDRAIRWCWVFIVHEFFCIFVPVQMLYEVYHSSVVLRPEPEIV